MQAWDSYANTVSPTIFTMVNSKLLQDEVQAANAGCLSSLVDTANDHNTNETAKRR
jgi:hypothetical protein